MKKSRNTLKSYFETGDIPVQEQFEDLIDGLFHPEDGKIITEITTDPAGIVTINLSDGDVVTITPPISDDFVPKTGGNFSGTVSVNGEEVATIPYVNSFFIGTGANARARDSEMLNGILGTGYVRKGVDAPQAFNGSYLFFKYHGPTNVAAISVNDDNNSFYFNTDGPKSTTSANANLRANRVYANSGLYDSGARVATQDWVNGQSFLQGVSWGGITGKPNLISAEFANGYWGMVPPDGNNVWVRTTQLGIIPYQSGGHGRLGTQGWPFDKIYGNELIEQGKPLGEKYLKLTGGTLTGNLLMTNREVRWSENTDSASIGFKNTSDSDSDSYLYFKTADNDNEYFRWLHKSSGTDKEWMQLKAGQLMVNGNIRANGDGYFGKSKKIIDFEDNWLRLNPSNAFSLGIYCASSVLRTDNELQVGPDGNKFRVKSTGETTILSHATVKGHVYGRSKNGEYSHLYRFGGLHFTWDSDTYGTNTQHSIKSAYGTAMGDSLTMNSYNHIRLNLDSNNNNADSRFEIGHNTTGTSNTVFSVTETGVATSNEYRVKDANTRILEGAGNSIRVQTNSGHLDLGPQNTSYAHINTNLPKIYLNKLTEINGDIKVYQKNTYMRRSDGAIFENGERVATQSFVNGFFTGAKANDSNLLDGIDSSGFVRKGIDAHQSWNGQYLIFNHNDVNNVDAISYNDSTNSFYFNADRSKTNTSANAHIYAHNIFSNSLVRAKNHVELEAGDGKGFRFWSTDNYKIYMSNTSNATWGGRVTGDTNSDYNMYFRMTGGTNRGFVFRSDQTNVAGIDSAGNGRFKGNIVASGDVTAFSDRRLKRAIQPVQESFLNRIDQLKPSYYQWKDKARSQVRQLGFIAQEVKELFPEWVNKDGEHFAMTYDKMGAVLAVKGIQELHAEIKSLKEEIKLLKNGVTY